MKMQMNCRNPTEAVDCAVNAVAAIAPGEDNEESGKLVLGRTLALKIQSLLTGARTSDDEERVR